MKNQAEYVKGYRIPSINIEEGKDNNTKNLKNPSANILNTSAKKIFDTDKSKIKF